MDKKRIEMTINCEKKKNVVPIHHGIKCCE